SFFSLFGIKVRPFLFVFSLLLLWVKMVMILPLWEVVNIIGFIVLVLIVSPGYGSLALTAIKNVWPVEALFVVLLSLALNVRIGHRVIGIPLSVELIGISRRLLVNVVRGKVGLRLGKGLLSPIMVGVILPLLSILLLARPRPLSRWLIPLWITILLMEFPLWVPLLIPLGILMTLLIPLGPLILILPRVVIALMMGLVWFPLMTPLMTLAWINLDWSLCLSCVPLMTPSWLAKFPLPSVWPRSRPTLLL
ncbi:MAG: hypothetical protein AAGJ80_02580, partial [Cyanobacteria bacterium J06553_1]